MNVSRQLKHTIAKITNMRISMSANPIQFQSGLSMPELLEFYATESAMRAGPCAGALAERSFTVPSVLLLIIHSHSNVRDTSIGKRKLLIVDTHMTFLAGIVCTACIRAGLGVNTVNTTLA